jgi:hypothetical protein
MAGHASCVRWSAVGFWALARSGVSYLRNIRPIRPATDVFSSGWARESWSHTVRLLAEHLWMKGKLKLEEAFVDAAFAGAKKGSRGRPDPSAQGHKDSRYRR